MKKPHVANDYDDIVRSIQAASEQMKSIDSTATIVKGLKQSGKAYAENLRLKDEAVRSFPQFSFSVLNRAVRTAKMRIL